MVATLPDLSIVYKLHLESGHMINLFDWMQAFRSIVDPNVGADDEDAEISPQIQYPFCKPKINQNCSNIFSDINTHNVSLTSHNLFFNTELGLHGPWPKCSFSDSSKRRSAKPTMWLD